MKKLNKIIKKETLGKEVYEYDREGRDIHLILENGEEIFYEYDERGLRILEHNLQNTYRREIEYDKYHRKIHEKTIYEGASEAFEVWIEYNEEGQETHIKNSEGREEWFEYDDNNRLIHTYDSEDFHEYWEYDEDGYLIRYTDSSGKENIYEYYEEEIEEEEE